MEKHDNDDSASDISDCHDFDGAAAGTKKRSGADRDVAWSVDRCVGLVLGGWVIPDVDDVD